MTRQANKLRGPSVGEQQPSEAMFQDTLEIAKRKYSELTLDKRDKGWFAHWSILQEIDGEGLKTTLIRNREFALRGIQELGFVPPDSVNSAISDLRSARRLTQALRQWKTNRKPDFGERVLIGFFCKSYRTGANS